MSTNTPQNRSTGASASKSPLLRAAWDRYLAELDKFATALESSEQYDWTPRGHGRAYHVLFEIQAMAFNFAMVPRLEHPRIFRNTIWQRDIYTVGGNCQDFYLGVLFLDGRHTYRLHGNMHESVLVLAQLNTALPGSPGSKHLGSYDFSDFAINPDGSFEVTLSAEQPKAGNWIKLEPGCDFQWIQFRTSAETWEAVPATLYVDRTSPVPADQVEHYNFDEFGDEAVARRIDYATGYVRYLFKEWAIAFTPKMRDIAKGFNIFAPTGTHGGEVGSPIAGYCMVVYEVDDDEALIFELKEEPTGKYWSFQMQDVWLRSLNFIDHQTALSRRQLDRDADGAIRVVVSRKDPGIANWLDNLGQDRGMVCMRNYRASKTVLPSVKRVKLAELDRHLPAGTRRVSPAERQTELAKRRAAYLRRHGE